MRENRPDRLPDLAVCGQRADLGLRVIAWKAQQFGPGLAAGAENANPKPIY